MSRKPNLNQALHQASGKDIAPEVVTREEKVVVQHSSSDYVPPVRRNKKAISGYFDPAVSRQLKFIAVDRDTTIQALLTEALNDLLEKYGKQPIA